MLEDKFVLSGFSDEISSDIITQFRELKKLGISYFEPRGINGKNISELTIDEAKALKKQMDEFGIKASSIGSPIGKISVLDDFSEHLKKLSHVIEIAKILKTKYIRVFSFYIPEGDTPQKWRSTVMERMRKMAELAEKEGVILLHENEHKIYGETAGLCKDILEEVDSPALGCVFDMGNFSFCGYEAYPKSFRELSEKITYLHIKDSLLDKTIVPPGMGKSSIKEILSELKKDDKKYFLSLEPHLAEFDGLKGLIDSINFRGDYKSGKDTFRLAYDCLQNILKEI